MAVKEAVPRYGRINYPSLDERLDHGRTARDRTPPSSHGGWGPAADRPDLCGWTLARAHARSGDPVAMAEYLAGDDGFDQSVTDFCERYADQNERDYAEFVRAVRSGRLEAVEGV
jgi:hypothetical protein